MNPSTLSIAVLAFINPLKSQVPNDIYHQIVDCIHQIIPLPGDETSGNIIQIAETCALGLNKDTVITPHTGQPTPLKTVFEHLDTDNMGSSAWQYAYPMDHLSMDSIFPNHTPGPHLNQAYKDCMANFIENIPKLYHQDQPALWFEHLESLFMYCFHNIPVMMTSSVHNISLYDHARTTSAIAVAYSLCDTDMPRPFVFISGGLSGIQAYIFQGYGDLRKFRAKMLRGRSFSVSLLSEIAAMMICDGLGLPSISTILNAAGRFTILAPNTKHTKAHVAAEKSKINHWLRKYTFGETRICIADDTSANLEDIADSEKFADIWKQMFQNYEQTRYQPDMTYGVVADFNPNHDSICKLCGKRPGAITVKTDNEPISICKLCSDYKFLGTNLVKKRQLGVVKHDSDLCMKYDHLKAPIYDRYQIIFPKENPSGQFIKFYDLDLSDQAPRATLKLIKGHIPEFTKKDRSDKRIQKILSHSDIKPGDPASFDIIATKAIDPENEHGVAALGVLKADIDDLGRILANGLKSQFTLSRMATLSRQLNAFFTLYLPEFLKQKDYPDALIDGSQIYTVFAGGDDLFLIGPWNHMISLACELKLAFDRYVCHNPNIHFSAGISFHKHHTPIDTLARLAEHELEQSKSYHVGNHKKDSITLFSETMPWDQLIQLIQEKVKPTLEGWLQGKEINAAILYRLTHLIDMAAMEKEQHQKSLQEYTDMSCAKWRSYLVYTVSRNAFKDLPQVERTKERIEPIASTLNEWINDFGGKMRVPVWHILYDKRKKR
jgi:CRISPR-associated protein Csm1